MKTLIVQANDAGQRLDKFIFKVAPQLPKSLLYKAIRKKDVKLNGKRVDGSIILQANDVVEIYLHSKFFVTENTEPDFLQASPNINVIFEDSEIIIVNKPSGLLMHGDSSGSKDTLINRTLHYLYQQGSYLPQEEQGFTPAFCNRLDRNTSGLVVAAKTFPTLQLLNEKMKQREITRKYLCVVHGILEKKSGVLLGHHSKNEKTNQVTITTNPQRASSPVETRYHVLKEEHNKSLLEVELITGRSHQIRAHLSWIGHPIVGDHKYGETNQTKHKQLLCAYFVGFDFTTPSQHLTYLTGQSFQLDSPFSIR